jgi:hypothetical protein
VLGGHGIAINGAQVSISDRTALEAFVRPDPVRDSLT